ncbi:MAG: hypothetical protein Q4C47_07235, partial [Planctomycetia bacterium]|nr:hypothetical protein [Planctomycetia bacterium]
HRNVPEEGIFSLADSVTKVRSRKSGRYPGGAVIPWIFRTWNRCIAGARVVFSGEGKRTGGEPTGRRGDES